MNENARTLQEKLSLMCNSFSPNYDNFISAIPEEEKQPLVLAWIRKCGENWRKNLFDGRNELACKTCAGLLDLLNSERFEAVPVTDFAKEVAELESREHRTLQQTFTGLILRLFRTEMMGDDYADIEAVARQYSTAPEAMTTYYRLPLI